MKSLPKITKLFIKWMFIDIPKYLFDIGFRALVHTNNLFSLTLNLKLFFTPIYGDYTIVGRGIGLVIRIFLLLTGLPFLFFVFIFTIAFPVFWFVFNIYLIYLLGHLSFLYLILIFSFWAVVVYPYPRNKVSKSLDGSVFPHVIELLQLIEYKRFAEFAKRPEIQKFLFLLEIDTVSFAECLTKFKFLSFTESLNAIYLLAKEFESDYVDGEHLFYYLLISNKESRVFERFEISEDLLKKSMLQSLIAKKKLGEINFFSVDYKIPKMGGTSRGLTGRVTPVLDAYSSDITAEVSNSPFDYLIGKDEIVTNSLNLLSANNTNVLILGPVGVGKTSLIKGIAKKILEGSAPKNIRFKRIVKIDPGNLFSGSTPDLVVSRINTMFNEAIASGDIIIFIDDVHRLLTDFEENSGYDALMKFLASGKLQFIVVTNNEEYSKKLEANKEFLQLFNEIEIFEADKDSTIRILFDIYPNFEFKHKVKITHKSIYKLVELSEKLIHNKKFPDKAVSILERCVLNSEKVVNSSKVEEIISEISKVPIIAVNQSQTLKALNIEENMQKKIIGQDNAIFSIGRALKRAAAGMRDSEKPIASFLFVGTTGVGKTETVKVLASEYFGSKDSFILIDMSEYQTPLSINKLIGAPNQKGLLTELVKNKPFSVILLDEIEKADSRVILAFLQVLDSARLTDSTGETVDFSNTIIVATSNIGTRAIQEIASNNGTFEEMKQAALNEVRNNFVPEFLNRFTEIIVFRPLTHDSLRKITQIHLERIKSNAIKNGVKVSFSEELINRLAREAYSKEWGARLLTKLIEDKVESFLAIKILNNQLNPGDSLNVGLEVFEQ